MTDKYFFGRNKPDFIALLKYKATEEGGRKSAAHSTYRPLVEFPGLKPLTSGEQIFLDKEKVNPGDTVKAQITIVSVEEYADKLYVGQQFRFCESPDRTIGTGEILEIINKDLEKNNSADTQAF
jgi:translation elongation factor EF-Tu-like GTPase